MQMIVLLAATIAFSFTVPTVDDSSRDCMHHLYCPARSDSLVMHWRAIPMVGRRFDSPSLTGGLIAVLEDSARLARGVHFTVSHAADSTRHFLVRVWPTKLGIVAPCSRVTSIVLKAK